jgi:hypothetical protein
VKLGQIAMTTKRTMQIPRSRGDDVCRFVMLGIVFFFTLLAIANLWLGIGLIAPLLWLALLVSVVWSIARQKGGMRPFFVALLGSLLGRRFAELESAGTQSREICFGFQLLGHRFIQMRIPIDKIESVEWSTGQSTHLAGRDMNDWQVWVWFGHFDPLRTTLRQVLYGIGPAGPKERTEALGLAFIEFLNQAGLPFIQSKATSFARQKPVKG